MQVTNNNDRWIYVVAIILILSLLIFTRCGSSVKYVPVETIVTEKEFIRDTTIIHKLSIIRDTVIVNDTISYIENEYAESWAVWSLGKLHHSLFVKPVDIPIKVRYVDKWREFTKEVPIEVEIIKYKKEPYNLIEKILMSMGVIFISYICFSVFKRKM